MTGVVSSAALLMDGGYVIERLRAVSGHFPAAAEVRTLAVRLTSHLEPLDLYRIFFYHADPYTRSRRRSLGRGSVRFAKTSAARQHHRLLTELEESPDFAVRRGTLAFRGWRIRPPIQQRLLEEPNYRLSADDFAPDLVQKGVDMRIGLDMAALAFKRLVTTVVVVSADTDMVPAMRFARREGLRVGLAPLGVCPVHRQLRAHSDFLVEASVVEGDAASDATAAGDPASDATAAGDTALPVAPA